MIGNLQSSKTALASARSNLHRGFSAFGNGLSGAERMTNGVEKIHHVPKFKLDRASPVFTIGSCFARNIEVALFRSGLPCLTRAGTYPDEMYELTGVGPRNGALNAYTPGSMRDLVRLVRRPDADEIATVSLGDDLYADMLLSGLRFVSADELRENRAKLLETYRLLPTAKTVIITLGYTESWKLGDMFVNRAPAGNIKLARIADRFDFLNMAADQVLQSVRETIEDITDQTGGAAKIIVTVSPVPIGATFTDMDVIVANDYSKATLLSTALSVAQHYDNVDYYPSFQFVTHMPRAEAFDNDGVHVRLSVVERIVDRFIRDYFE